jgi:hypothetical protein
MNYPDVIQIKTIAGFSEFEHFLRPGRTWRIGRSLRCEVSLRNSPQISSVALAIRFPDVSELKPDRMPILILAALQRGAGRIEVKNSRGDRMLLANGSPPIPLAQGEDHSVRILAPGQVAAISFRTPGLDVPGKYAATSPTDTQTWTISGERGSIHPQWVDVAALACTIDQHPEIIPVLPSGEKTSPSVTLRLATEAFLGHSSRSFSQAKLSEALDAAGIRVGPGQDKQARVVAYYSDLFGEKKLHQLAEVLHSQLICLLSEESDYT